MACSIPAYSCCLGCLHFSPHFSDCLSIRPPILRCSDSPSKGFVFLHLRFSIFDSTKTLFFSNLFLCWVFRFRTKHRIFNQLLKMLFSMPFFLLLRDIAPVFLRYCALFCDSPVMGTKRLCVYVFCGILQLLTQICLALSALLLHADPYSKPFDKLMFALQNLQAHDDGNVVLLELLTVLPEEISDTRHVSHHSDLRQEVFSFSFAFSQSLCFLSSFYLTLLFAL